jgi:hypothetical protein
MAHVYLATNLLCQVSVGDISREGWEPARVACSLIVCSTLREDNSIMNLQFPRSTVATLIDGWSE